MKDMLERLVEERARSWEQAKEIVDKAEAEKRDFSGEEQESWARANADLNSLDERIDQLTERMEREARADEARAKAERFIRPEREVEQRTDSLEERIKAWARGEGSRSIDIPLDQLRVDKSRDGKIEVRDLTVGSATGGGNTVPESFRQRLYEHLIENSAIRRTRAEIITTASGENLILPKTTAHPAAGTIVSEGNAIGESNPAFGQGTLSAYKYAELVQVSTELLTDTGVDLLGYLAQAFGRALGNGSGAHFVTGDGSSKPRGVIAAAGTIAQVVGGTGQAGVPTADELIDLFYTVSEPYAMNGEWFLRRATMGKIRKLKDDNNQYLWQPGLAGEAPNTILDRPYITDPNVPATATDATSIAFGDFSAYKIRDVGSLRFERSDDFAFDSDLVTFRAIIRTDGDLLDETGAIGNYVGGTA
jgi:HK97 family phage major capsid protein